MSNKDNEPKVSTHEDFQRGAQQEHVTALFNPSKEVREKAQKTIRAMAGHSPAVWRKLDKAAGIRSSNTDGERQQTEADASLPYNTGVNIGPGTLDEQFTRSTLVDSLATSGFGISSASLADYVYAESLRSGRMEADVSMGYRSRSTQNAEVNGMDGVPLPIIHVDYEMDARKMEVRRAYGEDPNERPAREARRAYNRREHELLFDGWGGNFNTDAGLFAVGGLNSTDPSKVIQAPGSDGWQDPEVVLSDIDALHDAVEFQTDDVIAEEDVPLVADVGATVIIPNKLWGAITRDDYQPSSGAVDEPLVDRIRRKYPYLQFVPAPRLESGTAIMLLNDPRYFSIVTAQGITNTAWDIDGGYATRHKLLGSRIPWVRLQPDGIKGIVRLTGLGSGAGLTGS